MTKFNYKENLVGEKFNRLLVFSLKEDSSNSRRKLWNCLCDCGKDRIASSYNLLNGFIKSCGCLQVEKQKEAVKLPKGQSAKNALFLTYKSNAKKRGHSFELNKEDFLELTRQNCYYCGVEPNQVKKHPGWESHYIYNGIDRLDNKKGYTKENTVTCCKVCNYAKNTLDFEQFKKWLKRVYINIYKKITDKTPGELIDALVTTNIKCFFFQEKALDKNASDSDIAKAADIIIELNKKRNNLMRSIDILLDFHEDMLTPKTYHSENDSIEKEF